MRKVWSDVKVASKTLDVHIFNLRRKLAKLNYAIRFVPPDAFKLLVGAEADESGHGMNKELA